ncbi:MAG: hypothetical protein ACREKL_06675 [Chthoniobacterales bacterium]
MGTHPSPIGVPGYCTYDAGTATLTFTVHIAAGEAPPGMQKPPPIQFRYDPQAATLTATAGGQTMALKLHSKALPRDIQSADLEKILSR